MCASIQACKKTKTLVICNLVVTLSSRMATDLTPLQVLKYMEIVDNEFLRQYEFKQEDGLSCIEYAEQDRKIFLTKLHIPENLDSQEFKQEFIRNVFEKIKSEKNVKIVPTHPSIAGFMRKNRNEYKELLPVGINI
jgi:hypothetical protein